MADTIHLQAARTRLSIVPDLGGRVAQIEALHHDTWTALLHDAAPTPERERDPMSWGSFVMAPWPNRIAGGRFSWGGQTYKGPPNVDGNGLHGVCFDRPWSVDALTGAACVLSIELDARWPFAGRARQRIEVLDDGVAQSIEIEAEDAPFPTGVGWHPWFRREIGGAQHVHALVDAPNRYELNRMLPTGRLLPVVDDYDLRGYPAVGARRLDDCYVPLQGAMRLRWDDLELWMESSENVTHAVVYTSEHAVCLEPQTCAIDAFNLDARGFTNTGIAVASAGSPFMATTTWRWASAAPLGE